MVDNPLFPTQFLPDALPPPFGYLRRSVPEMLGAVARLAGTVQAAPLPADRRQSPPLQDLGVALQRRVTLIYERLFHHAPGVAARCGIDLEALRTFLHQEGTILQMDAGNDALILRVSDTLRLLDQDLAATSAALMQRRAALLADPCLPAPKRAVLSTRWRELTDIIEVQEAVMQRRRDRGLDGLLRRRGRARALSSEKERARAVLILRAAVHGTVHTAGVTAG